MDQMEEKLGAILNNPQLMQQVMTMAQSLSRSSGSTESQERPAVPMPAPSPVPELDISALNKLTGLVGKSGIDREQRALLAALGPYLSRSRVEKLEKAMRAAKMATLASSFLGQGGLNLLTGR